MRRGTTPVFHVTVEGIKLSEQKTIMVTLKQRDVEVSKSGEELEVRYDTNEISFSLTQEETLSLSEKDDAKIQLKALDENGVVTASNIRRIPIAGILNERVMI